MRSIWRCEPVLLACVEVCREFVSRSAFQTWVKIILPIFLHEKSEREEEPLFWKKHPFFFFFFFLILAEGVLTHYIDHDDHESAIKKMLEPIRAQQRYVERSFTCFSAMRDIHIFSFKHSRGRTEDWFFCNFLHPLKKINIYKKKYYDVFLFCFWKVPFNP
jgi:hypothetical protein